MLRFTSTPRVGDRARRPREHRGRRECIHARGGHRTKRRATASSSGPRRSGLVQERSRRTRQQLVDAAVQLWTERGFEEGVEETTVEEIVQAAGVTKGTFYFHFAHKEDILLEVGWGTSEALFKDVTKALADDRSVDDVLDELLVLLARRISATPRAAVARTLAEFYRRPDQGRDLAGRALRVPAFLRRRVLPRPGDRPAAGVHRRGEPRRDALVAHAWARSTRGSGIGTPTSRRRCASAPLAARRCAHGRRLASDHMMRL